MMICSCHLPNFVLLPLARAPDPERCNPDFSFGGFRVFREFRALGLEFSRAWGSQDLFFGWQGCTGNTVEIEPIIKLIIIPIPNLFNYYC